MTTISLRKRKSERESVECVCVHIEEEKMKRAQTANRVILEYFATANTGSQQ